MKPQQTLRATDGHEVCLCPFYTLRITQGDFEGTHPKYAIDNAGKDSGKDPFYAPFTGRVVFIDKYENGNAFIFQSNDLVHTPSGLKRVCVMFIHCDELLVKKNTIYRQGDKLGYEGVAGIATGNHIHCEVSLVPYTKPYEDTVFNCKVMYYLPNSVPFEKAFYMNDTDIVQGKADWAYYTTQEGWYKDTKFNTWYYFENGKKSIGWKFLKETNDNKEGWYYFNPANGILQQSKYIDDPRGKCWVDNEGRWNGVYYDS